MKQAVRKFIPNWFVNWFWHLPWAIAANIAYGFPGRKLPVIGVTGTDGKTTTVSLIHHLLQTSGRKTAMVSTVISKIGDRTVQPAGLHVTSPHPMAVQKFLKQAVTAGCQFAVLEVTSHAIDQFRVWGIPFRLGVLTNITLDHTDYHGSFEKYKQTKINWLKKCQLKVASDSLHLNLQAKNIQAGLQGTSFEVKYGKADKKNILIKTNLAGRFNVLNCLAAIAAVKLLKLDSKTVKKALRSFQPPKGRLEIVIKQPFKVIVDFAHAPSALEAVLAAVKQAAKPKRLIHVFGATGDRDKSKRPKMGKVSSTFSDIIILTSDDTYSENPAGILEMIEKGIPEGFELATNGRGGQAKIYFKILDRKQAIQKAISLARPGDVVLLTGIGHQTSLNLGLKELPWSEVKEVKEAIKRHGFK